MKYLCLLLFLASCGPDRSVVVPDTKLFEGEACVADEDCEYNTCLELQGEKLCSTQCEIQSDCPYFPDQACFYTNGTYTEAHCFFLCNGDEECADGYTCQLASTVPSLYYICWPG